MTFRRTFIALLAFTALAPGVVFALLSPAHALIAAGVSVASAVVALIAGRLLLLRPLQAAFKDLTDGTRELSQARYSHRVPDAHAHELRAAVRTFNGMAADLET